MFSKLATIFRIPELRRKIFVTLGLIIVYRIGNWIPVPGVNYAQIQSLAEKYGEGAGGAFFALLNMVSGGSLLSFCLFSLGVMPYISASIIFQLLSKVFPPLEAIAKEGESGRRKIQQWTRYATVGLCVLQSLMVIYTILFRPVTQIGNDLIYLFAS